MGKGCRIMRLSVIVLFVISTSLNQVYAQSNLIYGERYNIQNAWFNYGGGYLDVYSEGCQNNFHCVSTTKQRDRLVRSGVWIILSATDKKKGEPVAKNDLIILQNMNEGDGGYLGTRGYSKDFGCGGFLCVSTYKEKDKAGSTTWKISGETKDGYLKEKAKIQLAGQWNNGTGGYLDIVGDHPKGGHNVCTNKNARRDGDSGTWRFIKR